jgi:hypothetical protein
MTMEKKRNPGSVYHLSWHENVGTLPKQVTRRGRLRTTPDQRDQESR